MSQMSAEKNSQPRIGDVGRLRRTVLEPGRAYVNTRTTQNTEQDANVNKTSVE